MHELFNYFFKATAGVYTQGVRGDDGTHIIMHGL